MSKELKTDFLLQIVLSNVQSASFQRASVYAPGAPAKETSDFQERFRRELAALEQRYQAPVTEEDHLATIVLFANVLSEQFSKVLRNGRMRIGIAQKAINLYLKFLWCLERIPEPPHCPLDNHVLSNIKNYEAWTKLDDIESYKRMVDALKKKAGRQSLAEWECETWNKSHVGGN